MITLLTICHAFTCICTIILFLCVVSLKNRNIELEAKLEYLESVCSKTTEICKDFKTRAWRAEKQADIYQDRCKTIEANTIRSMQTKIKADLIKRYGTLPHTNYIFKSIDLTAKELLEGADT